MTFFHRTAILGNGARESYMAPCQCEKDVMLKQGA